LLENKSGMLHDGLTGFDYMSLSLKETDPSAVDTRLKEKI
jgi:hypothetical protein